MLQFGAFYGFIAVSGLKMFKHVDLDNSKNLFVVAAILIPGIGGLTLNFGDLGVNTFATPLIQVSAIACALILGIVTNLISFNMDYEFFGDNLFISFNGKSFQLIRE